MQWWLVCTDRQQRNKKHFFFHSKLDENNDDIQFFVLHFTVSAIRNEYSWKRFTSSIHYNCEFALVFSLKTLTKTRMLYASFQNYCAPSNEYGKYIWL